MRRKCCKEGIPPVQAGWVEGDIIGLPYIVWDIWTEAPVFEKMTITTVDSPAYIVYSNNTAAKEEW